MPALLNPHQTQDVGSLVIQSGANIVCALETATWTVTKTNSDVRGLCRPGALNQTTARQGQLSFKRLGPSSNGFVGNDSDLTALTLGGVDVRPQLMGFSIGGTFDKADLPAVGVTGMAQGVVGQNYNGSVDLQIDDTDVVQALVIAAESGTYSAAQVALALTLNGYQIGFPIQLDGDTHTFAQAQYQRVTIPFVSQAPTRGTAFPTTPNGSLPGTPTLLDYALLTPRTNLSFVFISKLTHGLVRSGLMTWDSFNIGVTDNAINDENYQWSTFGDWTTTNNGA